MYLAKLLFFQNINKLDIICNPPEILSTYTCRIINLDFRLFCSSGELRLSKLVSVTCNLKNKNQRIHLEEKVLGNLKLYDNGTNEVDPIFTSAVVGVQT